MKRGLKQIQAEAERKIASAAAESTPMKRGLKHFGDPGAGTFGTCRREHPDEEGTETRTRPRREVGEPESRREHPDEEGTETKRSRPMRTVSVSPQRAPR